MLPLLRDLLHHLLHESDRRRASVYLDDTATASAELEGDPVLKVHQEVVVELDEEVALLERRQRDSLLELHRELMPQLALVEAPELGEELGELGLLARLPVEERVNLSGAAHRSRLDPARFPYPLNLVRGDDTGADGRPDRRAPLDVTTRPKRESPVRLVSLTRRRRRVAVCDDPPQICSFYLARV